jgi:hypothetical protein
MTTLWSALTLFSATLNTSDTLIGTSIDNENDDSNNFKGINFQILDNSPYLMGLINDSREWTRQLLI